MLVKGVCGLLVILMLCQFGYCCKKVYYVPGYGEPNWYAKMYTDKLHKLQPCSEVEIFEHPQDFHMQPSSWKMVEMLKPKFQEINKLNPDGMHLIGLSQGGHIAWGLIQETPEHNVESFVSFSGAQNEVFAIPGIPRWTIFNVITRSELLSKLAYTEVFQEKIPIGLLWRDPVILFITPDI